jgi:uncharacterized protein YgbK (DUF1537 family)
MVSRTLIFKKIDSTLRGHVVAECEALLRVCKCEYSVLAPAFPAQGRLVVKGVLKVRNLSDEWSGEIGEVLAQQGLREAAFVETARHESPDQLAQEIGALRRTARYIVCDAASDEDLALVAQGLARAPGRPLWVGSAGLARQAAQVLAARLEVALSGSHPAVTSGSKRAVIVCAGSDHPATQRQVKKLVDLGRVGMFNAQSATPAEVQHALRDNLHLLLLVDTLHPEPVRILALLQEARRCGAAGIVLTGGDTAELACRVTGARAICLKDEVTAGIPWGYLEHGILDGLPVVTKSGGFGADTALLEATNFLSR